MIKLLRRISSFILSVALVAVLCTRQAAALTPELNIASDAYVVIDAATGQVLIEKNMSKRKAPASITKIMTLALALEKGGIMDDVITVSRSAVNAVEPGSTHIALEVDEQITFRDAVMGTQLISANDAANVISEYVCGSMSVFVDRMNAKVAELGLNGTQFANPNGLDANGHYVTAYDMAQITKYALTVPGFREIFAATEYQMPVTNKKARNYKFYAQNSIMFPENREYYDGITGSKLGYTHNANHTLVASAKHGTMELIVVALDSSAASAKYKDAKLLLDYCFEHYETVTLSGKEISVADVPIASADKPSGMVSISSPDDHTFVVPLGTAKSSLEIRYDIPDVYKNNRSVEPSFSVYTSDGQLVYTSALRYYITPNERLVQAPLPAQPKPISDYFDEIMMVAFKCLLVGLAVAVTLFFVCRTVIWIRYCINRRQAYKRKLKKIEQQKLAIQRSAAEIKRLEAELGMQLSSVSRPVSSSYPNNVTRIYPNRVNPIQTKNASQND